MARPIVWTEDKKSEAIELILSQIFEGKSCRSILNSERVDLPSHRLFIEWLSNDPILSKQYAHACEARADLLFEEIIEISDDSSQDLIEIDLGDGVISSKLNSEFVQRSRLKVDARKWVVAKMNPKKYGEKMEVENKHEGEIIITRRVIGQNDKS